MSSTVLKLSKTEIQKLKSYYTDYLLNKKSPIVSFQQKRMAQASPPTPLEKYCFKETMLNRRPQNGGNQNHQQ